MEPEDKNAQEQAQKPQTDQRDYQIKELTETLQRLQADFENYKKRVDKEKQEFMQFATREFVKRILPIIDNFEVALAHEQSHEDFKKGVELIYAQMREILPNHGIEEIDTEGKTYDPFMHQAMMTVHDPSKKENEIIEVFQKGYKMGNNAIRQAKVKVNKLENQNNKSRNETRSDKKSKSNESNSEAKNEQRQNGKQI